MEIQQTRAHSHRIIGSAIYDGLVLMGVVMIAGAFFLPLNQFITGDPSDGSHPIFQLYLVLVVVGYFFYFWKKSGQTVGMRAWRIKLVNVNDQSITLKQLTVRLIVAIPSYLLLLAGVLWQYVDSNQLNWQDRASGTKLVHLPKKKYAKK